MTQHHRARFLASEILQFLRHTLTQAPQAFGAA
jgi:hypothetical protein